MSYILDALKRADAQRERGAVPGLHARQVTSAQPTAATATSRTIWPAVAAALALVAIAAALWAWHTARNVPVRQAPESAPAQVTPSAQTVQALPAPSAAPVTQTVPPAVLPAPPPPATSASLPSTADPATASASPRPPVVATASPSAAGSSRAGMSSSATASPSATASTEVPLLAELSDEVRRKIPALTITGAVFSDNPAQRTLVVNNQVLNQGSLAAPDVRLEEIGIDSSVFSFRGTRFRLAH